MVSINEKYTLAIHYKIDMHILPRKLIISFLRLNFAVILEESIK